MVCFHMFSMCASADVLFPSGQIPGLPCAVLFVRDSFKFSVRLWCCQHTRYTPCKQLSPRSFLASLRKYKNIMWCLPMPQSHQTWGWFMPLIDDPGDGYWVYMGLPWCTTWVYQPWAQRCAEIRSYAMARLGRTRRCGCATADWKMGECGNPSWTMV